MNPEHPQGYSYLVDWKKQMANERRQEAKQKERFFGKRGDVHKHGKIKR